MARKTNITRNQASDAGLTLASWRWYLSGSPSRKAESTEKTAKKTPKKGSKKAKKSGPKRDERGRYVKAA